MTDTPSAPAPDERATTPLPPVDAPGAPSAGQAAPGPAAPGPTATAAAGSAAAYPATGPATGQVPPRRRVPGWVIGASIAGGVVLLGLGFAGGLGTGLLIGHRDTGVVERAELRGGFLDRLDQDGAGGRGSGWGEGTRRPGTGRQGALPIPPDEPSSGTDDATTESATPTP